jgi:Flp pilus assembly pilin Flp
MGGGGELPEMVWWRWLILSILAWVAADVVLVMLILWRSPRLRREEGQTMAEYAVALTVIAVLAIAAFTVLSGGITQAVNNVTTSLP